MLGQNLNPETIKKNEARQKEFDNQKADASSRTTNSGLKPDEQKENQTPQANELYQEDLPPESRVISNSP